MYVSHQPSTDQKIIFISYIVYWKQGSHAIIPSDKIVEYFSKQEKFKLLRFGNKLRISKSRRGQSTRSIIDKIDRN